MLLFYCCSVKNFEHHIFRRKCEIRTFVDLTRSTFDTQPLKMIDIVNWSTGNLPPTHNTTYDSLKRLFLKIDLISKLTMVQRH